MIFIGLDSGLKTGYSIWNGDIQKFEEILTLDFWRVINRLQDLINYNEYQSFKVIIEDVTKSKAVFGKYDRKAIVGIARRIGGLIRECELLIQFCELNNIPLIRKVPNRNSMTKLSAEQFKALTGWTGRTSQHGRDASTMIFKMK